MAMEGEFAKYLEDVYSADPVPREALTDECEILVVGAGFAGLLLWYKLQRGRLHRRPLLREGRRRRRHLVLEPLSRASPATSSRTATCPLLEEMGYVPTMKFASGFEILEYCQKMAEKFGFYDHCLFHTTVEQTEWDEETGRWTVYTDRGDAMRARFVILANGILTTPEAGPHRGHGDVPGRVVPHLALELQRRPATASASASSAPAPPPCRPSPSWPRSSSELYVFQRTPSTIDVRDQRATTPEEIETWANEPGWARARRARFAKISAGRTAIQANDDYLAGKVADFKERKQHERQADARGADRRSSSTRTSGSWSRSAPGSTPSSRIPKTAAALKPYYPYGCKRPTFHDEYLPTFNLPHVHLVDTAPMGVQRDQRARRRARRRRVPARRADLRHRLPVDGDVDVQHDRRAAAAAR